MKPFSVLALLAAAFAVGADTPAPPRLPGFPPPPGLEDPVVPVPALPVMPRLPSNPPAVPPPERVPLPLPDARPSSSLFDPTAAVGSFVVLKDDRLVEGTVRVEAEKLLVRRGVVETAYPRTDVAFVGATKEDVYRFRKGTVDDADAAARLRLAKWCAYNGLREQGLAEAREVMRLDPTNGGAALLARSLDESLRRFPPAGTPAAPPRESVRPAADPEPCVGPEAYAAFQNKVQPILMNLCASCHARPDATGFKLVRPVGPDPTPQATRVNLRAVLAQVRKDDPPASPLFVKALAVHGGMRQPAFLSRQAPAFEALVEWVRSVVGPGKPPPAAVPPERPKVEPRATPPIPTLSAPPAPPPASKLPPVPPPPGLSPASFGVGVKPQEPTAPSPRNVGAAVDEFDPSTFNRAAHPDKVKASPAP